MDEDLPEIKRGDPLEASAALRLHEYGLEVADLAPWTARGQARRPDGVYVGELSCTLDALARRLYVWADTSAWPLGVVAFDVELRGPAGACKTLPTQRLRVVSKLTGPARV